MKIPETSIHSDGICVYVFLKVNNPIVGKIALILADLFILFVALFALSISIPALFLVSLIFLGFLLKYTFWNFYGKENLIINTKAFTYQHDYGFFRTSYKKVSINNRLMLKADNTNPGKYDNQFRLIFTSYGEFDSVPFEVYTTSLVISKDDLAYLDSLLQQLYIDKLTDDYEFYPINLN